MRWFQGETRAKLAESIDRSSSVLGGYVRGTATVALVDAVLIGIGLAVLGVPLTIPLAVIVFIGAFIPVLGATVTGVLADRVTAVTNGPVGAAIVIIIVLIVNQLESNLLQPVVMGCALSLHPLIVLLALAIGTIAGGIMGAILAVPYTALAWLLIQIWTHRYQTGDDPVLGPVASTALPLPQRSPHTAAIDHLDEQQRGRRVQGIQESLVEHPYLPATPHHATALMIPPDCRSDGATGRAKNVQVNRLVWSHSELERAVARGTRPG